MNKPKNVGRKRVIVLGLDGGTWNKILPLVEEKKLPFFGELLENHAYGNLKSTILPITCVAWPSMFTGKNAGKFGLFDFGEIKDYNIGYYQSSYDIKAKFLWEHLQENGLKCGIINIPLSSPFRSEIEFGEGDHLRKDWRNFSWSEDTSAGLDSRNPNFDSRMLYLLDLRFDQLDFILKNKEFDFLAMNVFTNDTILHFRWDNDEYIEKALKKIDSRLEKFIKKLDENTTTFIVSDHGMGKADKFFHINNWLENKGFLKLKKEKKTNTISKIGITKKNFNRFVSVPLNSFLLKTKLMRFIPNIARNKFRNFRNNLSEKESCPFKKLKESIDWEKTTAYGLGSKGSIFINLKNREKNGSVEKEDYDKIREDIIRKLKESFKEEEISTYKKEDVYNGPHVNKAADILFIINDGAISSKSNYLFSKDIFSLAKKNEIQADHQLNGIFVAHGKDIKKSKINASIYDITPTILHIFDIPVPKDMDGKVLTEIFKENSSFSRQITYEDEKKLIKNVIDEISF
ncbi:MAG: alkaline phosphatase family protein [Candidatus Thorarchaeota archaeon]